MPGWEITYADDVPLYHEITDDAELHAGTPITIFEVLEDGYFLPGRYLFTFASITGSGSGNLHGDVTVEGPSENYSRLSRTFEDVHFDGTWNTAVLEGVRIKFSVSASFLAGWKTALDLGYLGTFTAGNPERQTLDQTEGYDPTNFVAASGPDWEVAHEVHVLTNRTGKTARNAWVVFVPVLHPVRVAGLGLSYVGNSSPAPVEKHEDNAGGRILAYRFEVTSIDTGVTPHEIGFTIDDDFVTDGIQNTDNSSTGGSAGGIQLGIRHQFLEGQLEGSEFTWDTGALVGDLMDVYVEAVRYAQGSPDNGSGEATTRRDDDVESGELWGATPIGLTPVGGSVRQVRNNESVSIHLRHVIAKGAPFAANPASSQGYVIVASLTLPSGYGGS